MSNKYRLKKSEHKTKEYNNICIRCGKVEVKTVPVGMPLPNATQRIPNGFRPSWFNCKLGNHAFYPEHNLETNQ